MAERVEPFSPLLLAATLVGTTLFGGGVASWRGHDFLAGAAAGLMLGLLLAIAMVVAFLAVR